MKVLITGANGFVGTKLISTLSSIEGWEITATGREADTQLKCSYVQCDLTYYNFVVEMLQELKPDFIFHLAGMIPGVRDNFEDKMISANLVTSLNLLEAISRILPTCRILMMGTAAEYGRIAEKENPIAEDFICRPEGHYALSKYWMSKASLDYYQRKKIDVIIARCFNVIGPGISQDNVAGAFLMKAKNAILEGNRTVKMGNLSAIRDYLDVRDLCRLLILLMQKGEGGEIYNVGSGVGVSTLTIIEKLADCFEEKIVVESDSVITQKKIDVPVVIADISKLKEKIDFTREFSLETSIYDMFHSEVER